MRIIIVGCGKVGYALAEQLSAEGHELILVDMSERRLGELANTLDVATVMTTARVRVEELFGKDLPGGRSTFTVRFEVKNVAELETIRKKLLNIRDVTGSRRGQN